MTAAAPGTTAGAAKAARSQDQRSDPRFRDYLVDLKARADLAAILNDHDVVLNRHSMAHCPFHEDGTPSFHADLGKGLFHCFGCGAGGDVITFIRKSRNCGFREAVDALADQVGEKRWPWSAGENGEPMLGSRNEIRLAAVAFYEAALTEEHREEFRSRRGLLPETLAGFRVGYGKPGLRRHLTDELGFDLDACVAAGVLDRSDSGVTSEPLQNRFIFPNVLYGQVEHMSGRLRDGEGPKWRHLKGKIEHLYNETALRAPAVILVEGPLDCLAVTQLGFPCVALYGTRTSLLLSRKLDHLERLLITLDADSAGRGGADGIARALGFKGRIVQLPEETDPGDFVARGGTRAEFQKLLDEAKPWVQLEVDRMKALPIADRVPGLRDLARTAAQTDAATKSLIADAVCTGTRLMTKAAFMDLVSEQKRDLQDRSEERDPDAGNDGAPTKASDSLARRLVELAQEAGVELFHDEREEPYARIVTRHGLRTVPVNSRATRRLLSSLAWEKLGKAPGGEVLTSAATTLGAIACVDGPRHRLWVRHARHDGALWVDLDGSRAVRVTSESWSVVDEPPILFRAFPHQRPLPDPIRGGDPTRVFEFLNLPDEDSRTLFMGHLVAALVPDVPIAALAVHGVQGAAKSTLFRVMKRLVDPSAAETRRGVKDLAELALVLFQNRLVVFDNMTALPEWMSDALCGAVTGDGWSKRALYTDEDSIYFEYQRAVALGGINLIVRRADLMDRCVILALPHIPPSGKREECEFWEAFERERGDILGGLLDLLSRAMAARPSVQMDELPRMADYCRWGAAAMVAAGSSADVFVGAYGRNVHRQADAALDASPVAEALLILMQEQREWCSPAGELMVELERVAAGNRIDTKDTAWPKSANWLSHRIREVEPYLEARGVLVQDGPRTGARRTIRLTRTTECSVTCVTSTGDGREAAERPDSGDAIAGSDASPSVTDCVTGNGRREGGTPTRGTSDGSDATSGTLDDRELYRDFEDLARIIDIGALRLRHTEEDEGDAPESQVAR